MIINLRGWSNDDLFEVINDEIIDERDKKLGSFSEK